MSIRNMDADLASNKLNELFHLHRYEDCVVFINRLSPITLKLVVAQISIEMYLSRLPYTIEVFEALYAKIFIMDPDNFPARSLQPERLIDKMVAYFSLLSDQNRMEPIDGAKLLDSFENVIRIISYVQPNLYSRLLYFKYAIDKALLRFEKDLASYNKNLTSPVLLNSLCANETPQNGTTSSAAVINSNSSIKASNTSLTNALLVSRASNMQACETMRVELIQTIHNCDKALSKLNEYISNLKSQKVFKDVQFYLNNSSSFDNKTDNNTNNDHGTNTISSNGNNTLSKSPKLLKKHSSKKLRHSNSNERYKNSNGTSSGANRSESVAYFNNKSYESRTVSKKQLMIGSSTICQDFIQNRLYLNKAMMNTIEQYLETIKLQQMLANLYEKIDLDKEILLVFTHLKREENYLNSLEPLVPLFKRYSLGFERCIQIWRRKCSADSLLLFNENINNQMQQSDSRLNHANLDSLYVLDNDESINLDRIHSSFSSSANVVPGSYGTSTQLMTSSSSPFLANRSSFIQHKKLMQQKQQLQQQQINMVMASSSMNTADPSLDGNLSTNDSSPKHHKYYSEVNLYSHPLPTSYNTMPAKLKSQQKKSVATDDSQFTLVSSTTQTYDSLTESKKREETKTQRTQTESRIITRSVESQTINELPTVSEDKEIPSAKNIDHHEENEEKLKQKELEREREREIESIRSQRLLDEIKALKEELSDSKDTIDKLVKNESKLKERMKDKELEIASLNSVNQELKHQNKQKDSSITSNYQFTTDIIQLYNNLNDKYRQEAYESLDLVKEIQNMNEFKLKLLFSVVVLAYRYVKLYVRDLKRKVKTILQINDRSNSSERSNSQKSQTMTPTIIVQKPEDNNNSPGTTENIFFTNNEDYASSCRTLSRNKSLLTGKESENSVQLIDNALTRYFQLVTITNSFDLNKIVEDVKEQLWSTLYEYPLKNCEELNSYINESVKTCWSFVNHQPPFKLDYSHTRFEPRLHDRHQTSNKNSEQILQYVWPSLIDSSNNNCVSKGIIIT